MDSDTPAWVELALERSRRARARELAAHRRAIQLHQQAAVLQERLGHPDRAEHARQHAALAGDRLRRAQQEQEDFEAALAN